MDGALDAVYGSRQGGLGGSAPTVARWLGELRSHFPSGVVRVVQQDAIDRLGLHQLLLEPEVLDNVTPDVHLAATLMSLRDALPESSRTVARRIVRAGGGGHRAAARGPHAQRRAGRAGPQRADESAAAVRDRLGPHDPGQPQALPARVPDGRPGAARRPRAAAALARGEPHPRARPEREHGRERHPRRRAQRRAGLDPGARHEGDRVRHERRGPDREPARPGRAAVRHPARRRHGHRPGARLLPDAREPPREDRDGARHRPVRGRRPGVDAAPRGVARSAPA